MSFFHFLPVAAFLSSLGQYEIAIPVRIGPHGETPGAEKSQHHQRRRRSAEDRLPDSVLSSFPFISSSRWPSAGCNGSLPLVFVLVALLPAVHITQQLPAQPHIAGRPAVETVQGGILEERAVSMEPSLLSPLPLRGTPSRPATLQQSGSEQL